MANKNTELLSVIGAMQTLIENYPFGIDTANEAKKYSSSLEFLLDALRRIGVNDHEIITFILEELIVVNDITMDDIEKMEDENIKKKRAKKAQKAPAKKKIEDDDDEFDFEGWEDDDDDSEDHFPTDAEDDDFDIDAAEE